MELAPLTGPPGTVSAPWFSLFAPGSDLGISLPDIDAYLGLGRAFTVAAVLLGVLIAFSETGYGAGLENGG
ncbi:hypothetical protein GALMADRAFT_224016 [Galerina marginata CBS 339.88]|uniref:Uncharacterized protein n=1 Tax=Galerina marginata (strain CBS 339.88) TaxID=685588 RepID=A0A067T8T2_GALM3|nr:hypothetical protein GALMADRAFT_224016 [Galerina marginata CBS 339.88]